MKSKSRICIRPFLLVILLIITISCSKKENNPPVITETVTDIEGNVYKTVMIGTQVWMAENLKTSKYRNGDLIGTTTASDLPRDGSSKYQWAYGSKESNVATYGRLYTWYAVTDTRNIAPTGWHVPNSREWMTLIDFLGGESLAGGQLKAKGESLWIWPNTGASNSSGFTALPGGFWSGISYQMGETGNWWTVATPNDYPPLRAYFFGLGYGFNGVTIWDYPMINGLSVRCVKD
ncbi:MAG: fibrobacter succinogenes major paralogous domain-containing protein [Mariniphaga sp.]